MVLNIMCCFEKLKQKKNEIAPDSYRKINFLSSYRTLSLNTFIKGILFTVCTISNISKSKT